MTQGKPGQPDDHALSGLVDTLYEAALEPEWWPATVRSIARVFDATAADFHSWDPISRLPDIAISHNMDHMLADYAAHYIHINPRVEFFENDPLKRTVFHDQLFISEAEAARNPFFNWVDREGDALYGLGMRIEDGPHRQTSMGVHFSRRQGPPEAEQIAYFEIIAPHFTRALRLSRRLANYKQQDATLADAVQLMHCGVILVDREGRMLFANAVAEQILRANDGLSSDRQRRLRAGSSRDNQALKQTIAAPAMPRQGQITFIISRPSGAVPYELSVAPANHPALMSLANAAHAIVLITRPKIDGKLSMRILQSHYGLTAAEIRLCEALLDGGCLAEIAERIGVAENTARTRLKQVFSKTGTHRHSDLILLLVGLCRDWV